MSKIVGNITKMLLVSMLLIHVFLTVSFADEEIKLIEDKSMQAGTFPVYLIDKDPHGNEISKVVKVTVTFPNTIQNRSVNEAIDASDFKSTIDTIESMSHEDLRKIGKARAWSTLTGEDIPIVKTQVEKTGNHSFKVTYTTEKGTNTTVNAIEFVDDLLPYNRVQYKIEERYELSAKVISLLVLAVAMIPISIGFYLVKQIDSKINDTYEFIYRDSYND